MNQKVKSILIIHFLGFNILLFTSCIAFKQLKALKNMKTEVILIFVKFFLFRIVFFIVLGNDKFKYHFMKDRLNK